MAAPSSSGSSSFSDDGGEWRDASRILPQRQAVHPLPPPPPLTLADRLGRAFALVVAAGIVAAVVGSIGWTLLDPGLDEDPAAAPPPPPPGGAGVEGSKGVDVGLIIFWAFFPALFLVARSSAGALLFAETWGEAPVRALRRAASQFARDHGRGSALHASTHTRIRQTRAIAHKSICALNG